MTEYSRQRKLPRIRIAGRPAARVRPTLDARLVDLSLTGARIEHADILRPGFSCTVDLPVAKGFIVLTGRIVWCSIVGSQKGADGERILRYESGLEFARLTPEQQAALSTFLEQLTRGGTTGDDKPSR